MLPTLSTLSMSGQRAIPARLAGPQWSSVQQRDDSTWDVPIRYNFHLEVVRQLEREGVKALPTPEELHRVMQNIGQEPVPWTDGLERLAWLWGRLVLEWVSQLDLASTVVNFSLALAAQPFCAEYTARFSREPSQLRLVA